MLACINTEHELGNLFRINSHHATLKSDDYAFSEVNIILPLCPFSKYLISLFRQRQINPQYKGLTHELRLFNAPFVGLFTSMVNNHHVNGHAQTDIEGKGNGEGHG